MSITRIRPRWQSPFYRATLQVQDQLWKRGIYWHNWIFGECTPEFGCCNKRLRGKGGGE